MKNHTWDNDNISHPLSVNHQDETWGQLIVGTGATVLSLALLWATL